MSGVRTEFTISRFSLPVKYDEKWGHGFTVGGEMPAMVRTVKRTSPADNAGLDRGDYILKISGNSVYDMRAVQVEKMLNNLVGRDLTLYVARPEPVPRNDQERRRALITLQNELNKAKGTKVNTAAFEGGRDPFKDAMDTLDDVLQSLGPMPIAKAPREDPYASSDDDESAAARATRKKRSPSPLTDNNQRAPVRKEATQNGGSFTFSVDDELESPPPSDDEEAFMDPLLDFEQQDSSFAFVSGGSSGKVAGTQVKDFTLEDFTNLVQGIAKSTQEKMAAKEKEQARIKNTKGEAESGRAREKDKQLKEKEVKEKPEERKKEPPVMVATEVVFEPSFVKKKHARVAPPPPKKVTPPVSPTTKDDMKATPTSVTMDTVVQRQKASPPLETVAKRESPNLVREEKNQGKEGWELPDGNEHRSASVEQTDFSPRGSDEEPPYATVNQLMLRSEGTFVSKCDALDPNYSTIPDLGMLEERPIAYEPPYASILELTGGTSLGTAPTMIPADDEARSLSPRSGSQSPDTDEIPPQVLDDHPYSRVNRGARQRKGKVSAHAREEPSFAQVKEEKMESRVNQGDPPYARVHKLKAEDDQLVGLKEDPPYAQVKKQKRYGDQPMKHGTDPLGTGVETQREKHAERAVERHDDPPYARVKKQNRSGNQTVKGTVDPPYAAVKAQWEEAEQSQEQDDDSPYSRIKDLKEMDVEQSMEQSNDPPYAKVKKQSRQGKEKHAHAGATTTHLVEVPKPHHVERRKRTESPTSPSSSQSPEKEAAKPISPVRKAPPLPPARKTGFGDDEDPYSEVSELILPLSELGIQTTTSNRPKENEQAVLGTCSDRVSAGIEREKQRNFHPTVPTEPAKRQKSPPPPALPARNAPTVPKQHQTVAKTQNMEQSITKQSRRFWKRLSVGDKGGKGDEDQVMLKGFHSHSDKPASVILVAEKQDTSGSKVAASLESEVPAVPPYRPSSPDSFPLSNRKGYVDQQQKGSASNVGLRKKGGSGTGLTSQQLKAMRRLSIQGQSELICSSPEVATEGLPFPVQQWSVEQVYVWLRQLNEFLSNNYYKHFQEHQITGRSLLRISDFQLSQMGVENSKHRAVLTKEISRLKIYQTSRDLKELSGSGV